MARDKNGKKPKAGAKAGAAAPAAPAGAAAPIQARHLVIPPGPLVTIFGAGIAGLTVAHELIERGFRVQVVDPAESLFEEGCSEVGGVAATQWSFLNDATLPFGRRLKLQSFQPVAGAAGFTPARILGSRLRLAKAPRLAYRIYFASNGLTGAPTPYDPAYTLGPNLDPPQNDPDRIENHPNSARLAYLAQEIKKYVAELDTLAPNTPVTIYAVGHAEKTSTEDVARAWSRAWALDARGRLQQALVAVGVPVSRIAFVEVGLGSSEPIGDDAFPDGRLRNNRVEFRVAGVHMPGDHGYRFFPGFYRNLDDTMRRTPLYDDDGDETGASAIERLKSTNEVSIALADGERPYRLPRRRARSLEEVRALSAQALEKFGYTPKDVALFQLQLFRFLTMCPARRTQELDTISWYDFVVGNQPFVQHAKLGTCPRCGRGVGHHHLMPFSEEFLEDMDNLPQALAGMRATEVDAHTNGTLTTQLLLEQLGDGTHVDRLLDGPTSTAWLAHWKRYLRHQGVKFFVGKLKSLAIVGNQLVPQAVGVRDGQEIASGGPPVAEPAYADEVANQTVIHRATPYEPNADYFVAALPVNQLQAYLPPNTVLPPPLAAVRDMNLGSAFGVRPGPSEDTVPFRDISGIQFYFLHNFHFAEGHAYHADSPWRLTSISQLQFWRQKRTTNSGYLSIVSVDIGEMHRGDTSDCTLARLKIEGVAADIGSQQIGSPNPNTGLDELLDVVETVSRRAREFSDGLRKFVDAMKVEPPVPPPAPQPRPPWDKAKDIVDQLSANWTPQIGAEYDAIRQAIAASTTPTNLPRFERLIAPVIDPQQPPPTSLTSAPQIWRAWQALLKGVHDVAKALTRADIAVQKDFALGALDAILELLKPKPIRFAWQSTAEQIAQSTWNQIRIALWSHMRGSIPEPDYFRIDSGLVFHDGTHANRPWLPARNSTPYFINATGGFDSRPGTLPSRGVGRRAFYEVAFDQWLLAGGVAKSHTRITSMEHANESGRHVVRAIMHHRLANASPEILGTMPRYWNPEDFELEDLGFLRRLDEILLADKLPHLVDILGLEEAVMRWVAGRGTERYDNFTSLLKAARYQVDRDFGPWIDATEQSTEPFRKLLEMLARLGMQPTVR